MKPVSCIEIGFYKLKIVIKKIVILIASFFVWCRLLQFPLLHIIIEVVKIWKI